MDYVRNAMPGTKLQLGCSSMISVEFSIRKIARKLQSKYYHFDSNSDLCGAMRCSKHISHQVLSF